MNIKQSSAALKAVDGFLKSRGVHLGAVSTLELVELMVVALATQPSQDEQRKEWRRGMEEAARCIDEIDDGNAPEYRACQEHIRSVIAFSASAPAQQATPPQPVAAEALTRDALIRNAQALLNLDADGALVPHGIGGHARTIIQAFIDQEAVK